ncbi:MAG TPA: RsmE family RNA methyltransferase [Armatimonadota bacterium]|nr:RsmE family RNA methyltransferase [Armatimonadota bacterium]HOS42179.1 RsmE family RNA methyltransferase [Armatimonadota bacterium]
MPATFLFITPDAWRDDTLTIGGARAHHLARVRRVAAGELLRAALPDGRVLRAAVTGVTATAVVAHVLAVEPPAGVSPCRITLCQAVLKGEKMELVVQKASELGAHTLAPVFAARSVPRWTAAQARERAARWARIAESAAEQCERSLPLRVLPPAPLPDPPPDGPSLLLHERAGRALPEIAAAYPRLDAVTLYLGPEGGWTDAEAARLRDAGAQPVHLGGRVLRAETASIAAVTLAQYLWGDLARPQV